MREKLEKETYQKFFGAFERLLKEHGSHFFCGDKVRSSSSSGRRERRGEVNSGDSGDDDDDDDGGNNDNDDDGWEAKYEHHWEREEKLPPFPSFLLFLPFH